jgi:metal iron transporter
MNCPSRVDPVFEDGYNQNPNALNADATTRADMEHMANARLRSDHCIETADGPTSEIEPNEHNTVDSEGNATGFKALDGKGQVAVEEKAGRLDSAPPTSGNGGAGRVDDWRDARRGFAQKLLAVLRKYAKFVGPGFMVAVAYIDPGMHSLRLDTCENSSSTFLRLPLDKFISRFTHCHVPILSLCRRVEDR